MTLKDLFLSQPDREGATTRKAVEPGPEGRNGFKPHQRSMELGYLASLVAGMPGWIAFMIDRDELELQKPGSEAFGTKAVGPNWLKALMPGSLMRGALLSLKPTTTC